MRAVSVLLILTLCVEVFGKAPELFGKWEDKKYKVVYEFKENGSLVFEQMGYPAFVNSYTLDKSVVPHRLDLTMKQGNRELIIPALLQIVDENTLKIEQFAPYQNPTEFTKPDDGSLQKVHVLKRVE